ncbi:MAG: RNA methyltransferase [Gordonia sp. (in: high G+C Gram-positive bacteria)]|nr:MAG: RNA methyltransferase [Gordonia sp. (in: high G+C Gram-positive bacteria)]
MAYNQELATRIRDELSSEADLTEKAMFGGLGFMLSGHMAVAANSAGDMMIRVAPERGAAEQLTDDAALARWVGEGRDYVRTLPPKRPKR